MKIIKITTLLDYGGQEQKNISFTNDRSILSNQYFFASIGHGGFAEKIIRSRGFDVVAFNKNTSLFNIKNIWTLYKWIKSINPDVVHTAASEANFHATIAAKLAGVKVVICEEIGFPNHSYTLKKIFKLVYKLSNKVICVSNAVKEYLININEIDFNKGVVVYNPLSPKKEIEKTIPTEFTIVSVGRLEKVKNYELLLKVFARLNRNSLKLILVGDGSERGNIEKLISRLNIKEKVQIVGFSSQPELFLSQASLFVLPSLSEGFGIAVVEAMQLGVPCICSCVGGIPEYIEEGRTGWLFNPNNEDEFLNKLSEIINLPIDELNAVGQNAKKYVSTNFAVEKYVKKIEELYAECHD